MLKNVSANTLGTRRLGRAQFASLLSSGTWNSFPLTTQTWAEHRPLILFRPSESVAGPSWAFIWNVSAIPIAERSPLFSGVLKRQLQIHRPFGGQFVFLGEDRTEQEETMQDWRWVPGSGLWHPQCFVSFCGSSYYYEKWASSFPVNSLLH